jgi:hypothetical protein
MVCAQVEMSWPESRKYGTKDASVLAAHVVPAGTLCPAPAHHLLQRAERWWMQLPRASCLTTSPRAVPKHQVSDAHACNLAEG